MTHEFHDLKIGSLFGFTNDIKSNENRFSVNAANINILWNRNKTAVEVVVDDMVSIFSKLTNNTLIIELKKA